jgi:hypothetical protein
MTRDISVGVATTAGWKTEGSEFQSRWGKNVQFSLSSRTNGALPAHYPMNTADSFLGIKLVGRKANHSTPTDAEAKKMLIYTTISQ